MKNNTIEPQKENNQFVGKYYYGLGRRKCVIAKVRLYPGKGQILINGKRIDETKEPVIFLEPLRLIDKTKNYDLSIVVRGGGKKAKQDAIRLGIARALLLIDKNLRPTFKKHGFLHRDPRVKERKKPGLKRARRAPQFSKR